MTDWKKELDILIKKEPKNGFKEFLLFMRNKYTEYLSGNLSDEELSNITVYWYATNEKFGDSLIQIDKRIKNLSAAMDITHPDFTKERKKNIVKELINRINEIIW